MAESINIWQMGKKWHLVYMLFGVIISSVLSFYIPPIFFGLAGMQFGMDQDRLLGAIYRAALLGFQSTNQG